MCLVLLSTFSVPTQAVDAKPAQCPSALFRTLTPTTQMALMEKDFISRVFKKENIPTTNIFVGIKQFQKKYGIEQTASIGPKTRAKLDEVYKKFGLCNVGTVTPTTNTNATPTMPVIAPVIPVVTSPTTPVSSEPAYLELLKPQGNGDEIVDQGVGEKFPVLWISKNLAQTNEVSIEIVGENYEFQVKSWKVPNTGRYEISSQDVDALPTGYYNLRIRYYCNSAIIPCAEDLTERPFYITPKSGYVAGVLHVRTPISGKVFSVNESQYMPIDWYTFEGSEYYKLYLGNVILNKEIYVDKTQSYGLAIKVKDLKAIKKDMTKTDVEIQNAYYVRVQAIKKENNVSYKEIVIKETTSGQFGIR